MVFYESTGSQKCRHKGLLGKVGLFEVLFMNDAVAKLIKGGHFLKIDSEVSRQGADSLVKTALIKAAAGLISPKELLRIAEEKII
jgi:type II secretory ATPase GspE/PulE/Tfp pilus assembly ATPase PilB-like protein